MIPAGCGNFLIVSYREIRALEFDLLVRLDELSGHGQQHLSIDISGLSKVDVHQFYAIEVEEFPARIAETALYLVDHLANMRLSRHFGQYFARIPLRARANVHVGNATRTAWDTVLAPENCSYIIGNPPFIGRQYRTSEQQADMRQAHGDAKGHAVLDYVTAWYALAVDYMRANPTIHAAFVSTNSIVQGESVPVLWSRLLAEGAHIDFAVRTFRWGNEARNKAGVHVVIVGFSVGAARTPKILYEVTTDPSSGNEGLVGREVENITPYLSDGPTVIVDVARSPISPALPAAEYGSMANDGGYLIVDEGEVRAFRADPHAAKYLREYVGGEEVLNGKTRWCLWLPHAEPSDVAASALLKERIAGVAQYRSQSRRAATQSAAVTPSLFAEIREQTSDYIFVPFVSSEKRRYLPLVIKDQDDICAAPHWRFPTSDRLILAVMSSRLFALWAETVGGRLEMRLRLSPGTVYNTFPWPAEVTATGRARAEGAMENILKARAGFPAATLALLYNPSTMPPVLIKAHQHLDSAVYALYGQRKRMPVEAELQAALLARYVEMTEG